MKRVEDLFETRNAQFFLHCLQSPLLMLKLWELTAALELRDMVVCNLARKGQQPKQ